MPISKFIIGTTFALVLSIVALASVAQYNNTALASNSNTTYVAVNLTNEVNNSKTWGYNFTNSTFVAGAASDCYLALIAQCNNNVATQFVCISDAYISNYQVQRINLTQPNGTLACPDFLLSGNIYCGIQEGHCVVMRSSYTLAENNSTSTATITPATTTTYQNPSVPGVPSIITAIVQFFQRLFGKL